MTIICDTPESINRLRLLTLRKGLEIEAKHGMRLTRGRTCYAIIKGEFGLTGSKSRVLAQYEQILRDNGVL